MKYLYALVIGTLFFVSQGISQGQNIVVDTYSHTNSSGSSELDGFTSYRIYAQLNNQTDEVLSVLGYDEMPISISTTTSFYQSQIGGVGGNSVSPALYGFLPDSEFDSYVTIGYSSSGSLGVPYNEDSTGSVDFSGGQFGVVEDNSFPWQENFENGENIAVSSFVGGGWFSVPGSGNNSGVGVNNSVLLGQFTTDGDFDFCIPYQVLSNGESTIYPGNCLNAIGCGDELACNYNPEAELIDNSTCAFEGQICAQSTDDSISSIYDENCDCITTIDEDDCNEGPNTFSYCYADNENQEWVFTETLEGNGVSVEVFLGSIETNFDELNIYEGEDGVFNFLSSFAGELSGSVFSTDLSELKIELITDGSVSCTSGSQTELVLVYSCSNISTGPILGCTDPAACNFSQDATIENGSCSFIGDSCTNPFLLDGFYNDSCNCELWIVGCGDEAACNYNSEANTDGECSYVGDECEEEGVLNGLYDDSCGCLGDILGCTDVDSGNYNELATVDDGSCGGAESCLLAEELIIDGGPVTSSNIGATNDNNSDDMPCSGFGLGNGDVWFSFIGDGSVVNVQTYDFDTVMAYYTECDGEAIDCDDDSGVGLGSMFSGICTVPGQTYYFEVEGWNGGQNIFSIEVTSSTLSAESAGCSDPLSCNYDETWACSDEYCVYPGASCNDNIWLTVNDVFDDNCNCVGEFSGCIDPTACNYNDTASTDDGSCVYPGDSCDDFDELTSNDTYSDSCDCLGETSGCTDADANNYDPNAISDDGSCCFGEFVSVVLYDSFGDGGASFTLEDSSTNEVGAGMLNTGEVSTPFVICAEDGCFIFALTPDNWPNEISADLLISGELVYQHLEGDGFDQYPIIINVGNDPECIILGCMDETACNYNGLVTEDDGSCDFEICVGCSEPGAVNYSDIVTQDDGSCYWGISGVVFVDDNYNGVLDPFEETLPYQNVFIVTTGQQIITDNDGTFMSSQLEAGVYELYVEYSGSWTNYTTPTELTLEFPINGGVPVYFGVTNESVPAPSACVDFYQWGAGVPCNDQLGYNICYRNMSPYPISGVIEVVLDDLLEYNYSNPPAESIDGQTISWSFENLASWEMFFDDLVVNTPSEQNIGDFMSSSVTIYVDYEGELIPITEQFIEQEVTCAYDPNDITGTPEGYTDDHLVLADSRMEYLIRFQNTGNASAGTVMVVDTLDVDMDFSTFQLVANSHNVMTTIEESGRVEFLFEDINLPDSISDEVGSHGMVSFKIDFIDNVDVGEEINSTAHIFFDNNPAVVTNTTWHTIHECGGEAVFELSDNAICQGEQITMISTNPLVENYQWNIQSASASTTSEYSVEFPEEGQYIIQLVAENPICVESSMQMLTVYNAPTAEVTEEGAMLVASEGEAYQWYLNDEVIYGASSQEYQALEDGIYTVEVTNESGCSDISEALMIVSIEEYEGSVFEIYPNPMSEVAFIEFNGAEQRTIRLFDAAGKEVLVWQNITDQRIEIQRGSLSKGTYFIQVQEGEVISNKALVIR